MCLRVFVCVCVCVCERRDDEKGKQKVGEVRLFSRAGKGEGLGE